MDNNITTVASAMWNSRKFRAAMIDAIVSILLMWVGYLVGDPDLHELIVNTILAIKVPTAMYIIGTAVEDAAEKGNSAAAVNSD